MNKTTEHRLGGELRSQQAARRLLEELADVRGEVRVEPHRQHTSFFDKLRDTFMG